MPLLVTPRQFAQRAEFYHQLAQSTSAGIGVVRALEQVMANPPARAFREPLQRILDGLARGSTLTESLQPVGWLPVFDVALVEAGERSGRLDACFRLLADYYNSRATIARQVITDLIYPVALIHFAVLIFFIVLPFAASQFNASLLLLFARAVLILLPFYGAGAALIYATQSKHGEKWRARIESILRYVPILGTARHYLALSRLAAALEALNSAGVNVVTAWDLAAAASGSPALQRAVQVWKPQVSVGQMPSEAVRGCTLFPDMFANLYASGEVSGKLDESLRHLHRIYGEEGAHKLHAFAQWTPRLIYFLVALLIAYEILRFWIGLYGPHSDLSNILRGF